MSAATRLTTIASITTFSAALLSLTSLPSVRDFLAKYTGPNGLKYTWRTLALLLALLNLKNFPLVWHIRVLRGIFYQLYLQPNPQKPKHLFSPMVTSSYNTPYDCDYNFHKSNSTYFADLDVARAHYMGCLIRVGLARLNRGDEEGLPKDTTTAKGKYVIALGAVSCFFHKQIEPLQGFEVFTRLLAWDRKWVYLVSHIVRKGVIKPESYVLQPWKNGKRRATGEEKKEGKEDLSKHIFATSVARYVFKKGRLTINPEIVLERSRLLPARPSGVGLPPRSEAGSGDPTPAETPATPAVNGGLTSPEAVATEISDKLGRVADNDNVVGEDSEWTWDDMERERLRGLKIARHFDELSGAQGELRGGDVLGEFGDYW